MKEASVRLIVSSVTLMLFIPCANAWMERWEPKFNCTPAKVTALPERSVSNFVCSVTKEDDAAPVDFCEGGSLDLNGDGVQDFVFIIPWMGCGLNLSGYSVHFIVSDGAKGRMTTVVDGYGIEMRDLVKVSGKTYFRHSMIFSELGGSQHNYWVYQVFSFGTNGVMRCANADFGNMFPAATIYYDNPKFNRVKLTADDLKRIAKETEPHSKKYVPK